MPKNFIITISILVVLIIIGMSLGIYFYQRSAQLEKKFQELRKMVGEERFEELVEKEKATEKICKSLPLISPETKLGKEASPTIAQDICYLAFALKKTDVTLCEKIEFSEGKGMCYSGLALKLKDSSLCEKIEKDYDQRQCYSSLAIELDDLSLCKKIKEFREKDYCLSDYAAKKGDAVACEKIINVKVKDECYRNVAFNIGNPVLCQKITDVGMREDCRRSTERY